MKNITLTNSISGNSVSRNVAEGTSLFEILNSASVSAGLETVYSPEVFDVFNPTVCGTVGVDEVNSPDFLSGLDYDILEFVLLEKAVEPEAVEPEPEAVAPEAVPPFLSVTINYGRARFVTLPFPIGSTVSDVLTDLRTKGALGYTVNVEGHISGVPMTGTVPVSDGTVINVYDKACEKA